VSVSTINYVRSRHDLSPTEFAVAYAMASHANPQSGRYCTASIETIGRESGLKDRRAVQRTIRKLEAKPVPVIFARTTRKGGSGHATGYEFNVENSGPTTALVDCKNSGSTGTERAVSEAENSGRTTARKVLKKKERGENAPTQVFPEKMEKRIQAVWNQYFHTIDPGPVYFLTIERKQMIADRLQETMSGLNLSAEDAINKHMTGAINAFAEDDYFMGRKPDPKHPGNNFPPRKGIENIFGTSKVYQDWCMNYHAQQGIEA